MACSWLKSIAPEGAERLGCMGSGLRSLVEGLEGRRLLSASLEGSTLNVVGTNEADNILVMASGTGEIVVNVNGVESRFSGVESIKINGGNGADSIFAAIDAGSGLLRLVEVSGDNAGDTVSGYNSDADVTLRLSGGNGDDVILYDQTGYNTTTDGGRGDDVITTL